MSVFYLLKVFHGGLEKAKTLFIDEGIEPTMRLFLKGTLLEQIFGIINQTPIAETYTILGYGNGLIVYFNRYL